jgi:hypothetical protein
MSESNILPGLDPDVLRRVVTVEADTEHIEKMRHRADVRQFTFYSDEPPELGGDEQHAFPLDYLTAAIGL